MPAAAASRYRDDLPQLASGLFLTDSGLETTLLFEAQRELPYFASFPLLRDEAGRILLRDYFRTHVRIAAARGVGIVLETPTWRASPDWGAKLGYDADALAAINRESVELLAGIRAELETPSTPIVISGNLGPRGDGYVVDRLMGVTEAQHFHAPQVEVFAGTAADMVAAFTMNYVEEAAGIALAAREARMPLALSFTLETDGRLPSGQGLEEAIRQVDALTDAHPAYYMINCAHPTHFESSLDSLQHATRARIRGLRANASNRSHAELDVSTDLDPGDPVQLGAEYRALRRKLPGLAVVGGCCGTNHLHIEAIASAMLSGSP